LWAPCARAYPSSPGPAPRSARPPEGRPSGPRSPTPSRPSPLSAVAARRRPTHAPRTPRTCGPSARAVARSTTHIGSPRTEHPTTVVDGLCPIRPRTLIHGHYLHCPHFPPPLASTPAMFVPRGSGPLRGRPPHSPDRRPSVALRIRTPAARGPKHTPRRRRRKSERRCLSPPDTTNPRLGFFVAQRV